MLKRLVCTVAATFASIGVAHAAWPEGPVTIVVPFAPGQTGDIIARLVAKELQTRIGQPFLVDNRAGAGGRTGTAYVAKAKPDGYTLLLTSSGPFAIAPALYAKEVTYEPVRDFAGVAETGSTPQVIAAAPQSGIASMQALIKQAKSSDLSYGSAGLGSLQHLTMELLKKELGFPMVHVPFKGSADAKVAVMGNTLPVTSDSLPAIYTSLKSGQLRPLAVVDHQRSPYLPDVPTLKEAGFKELSAVSFFGVVAPKGTPRDVVTRLNKEIVSMFRTSEFQQKIKEQALTLPKERTPEQFDAYLAGELERWKKVVQTTN